jgi:hypothetical protein
MYTKDFCEMVAMYLIQDLYNIEKNNLRQL